MELFNKAAQIENDYSAKDIEVLEGLEPVRMRPGMYIGGVDERALHHLVAEVLDNAMDEAVAGFANRIEISLEEDGYVKITDNGRGIPVDPHPKFPDKSALEVILTTLHSGGKFTQKAYQTAGGLHGVGISVVNALTDHLEVEVARDRKLYKQTYSRGVPQSALELVGPTPNRRGTVIRFHPDPQIFGEDLYFKASLLYRMARSKAYLYRGVEIRWSCPESQATETVPAKDTLHFPEGLSDFLAHTLGERACLSPKFFADTVTKDKSEDPSLYGKVEWAIAWPQDEEGFLNTYCNTIPTPQGGSHELGLRSALSRAIKSFGEMSNIKKVSTLTPDDILTGAAGVLSVFIPDPQFQGQTKEKLATLSAQRLVETVMKDRFENWLSSNPDVSQKLIEHFIERAEERLRRKNDRDLQRKTATQRLRLPGKLADCTKSGREGTELFIVEGDSAGGSAKQARHREYQAVLPLRGKILNVASASLDKLKANQLIADLCLALGCGTRKDYDSSKLRYDRVVIMTDADVDGAHIAALLMTFFYREMPQLIHQGHLYLALPPLFRLSHNGQHHYTRDEAEFEKLKKKFNEARGKLEITRFKGLGEMNTQQLKDTTMDPKNRTLLQITLPTLKNLDPAKDLEEEIRLTAELVEDLMGNKPEKRFDYIQTHAQFASDLDI